MLLEMCLQMDRYLWSVVFSLLGIHEPYRYMTQIQHLSVRR